MAQDIHRQYRETIDRVNAEGPFSASWEGLTSYRVPDWYQNGKFGIFIHWGLYAVPAFANEWYARHMYEQGSKVFEHHRATYGDQATFGYKDFVPQFTAANFDPDAWAALFRRAGAQFVVPTAEHHDGFPLYNSGVTEWSAAKRGPKRDLIGDLAAAVRRESMVFGVSSHRAEHWWFMNTGMAFDSDVRDPRNAALYGPAQHEQMPPNEQFLEDWLVRCCEIVDKYEPQLFWFDWWIEQPIFAPYLQQFASYYYNRGHQWRRGVAINYKHYAFPEGIAVLDIERGQLAGIREQFWQTDTAVAKNSWGYTENNDYKRPGDIIGDLVDIVSKNGALLLNIGPRADGTIPVEDQEILLEIGNWLRVNGEAIYGTRPWRIFGEGPTEVIEGPFADTKRAAFTAADIRFTMREETREAKMWPALYATALAIPEDRTMRIRSLANGSAHLPGSIEGVEMLTGVRYADVELEWARTDDALVVKLPENLPSEHAVSIKIKADGIR
ncbi:MAG TPA: alpha-L-fucosidase [Thermomicrobiales bacterium]|nr:alpha-L-fucosidase [Thermomicrobiales bacterium]